MSCVRVVRRLPLKILGPNSSIPDGETEGVWEDTLVKTLAGVGGLAQHCPVSFPRWLLFHALAGVTLL